MAATLRFASQDTAPTNRLLRQVSVLSVDLDNANNIQTDIAHCNRCFNCSTFLFQPSFSAFPKGSVFAFGLALVGVAVQYDGLNLASGIIKKYNPTAWWYIWILSWLATALLVLVNATVLLHGVALFINKGTNNRRSCLGLLPSGTSCGMCLRTTGLILVGVLGTIGIWVVYLLSLIVTFVCVLQVGISWVLEQSCGSFQTIITSYIAMAKGYLIQAATMLTSSNEQVVAFLGEFQQVKDFTTVFDNSGLGVVADAVDCFCKIDSNSETVTNRFHDTAGTATSTAGSMDTGVDGGNDLRRFLALPSSIASVDPAALLADGVDALNVLNQTIDAVKEQVLYYEQVSLVVTEFCFDAASLYKAVIFLSIGAFVVSVSQMLLFAFHVKQFTAWSYEIELVRVLDVAAEKNRESRTVGSEEVAVEMPVVESARD